MNVEEILPQIFEKYQHPTAVTDSFCLDEELVTGTQLNKNERVFMKLTESLITYSLPRFFRLEFLIIDEVKRNRLDLPDSWKKARAVVEITVKVSHEARLQIKYPQSKNDAIQAVISPILDEIIKLNRRASIGKTQTLA